jgi:hypothetical protein
MDSSIATDPRFKLMALDLGISRNELAGALFYVWLACYERRSERLSKRLADASAEIEGFANALVEAELADDDDDSILVHGAAVRIEFLLKQAEKGRKGGKKGKGKPKRRSSKANVKQMLNKAEAKPKQSRSKAKAYSPTLTPDPAPALTDAEQVISKWNTYFAERLGSSRRSPSAWAEHVAKALGAGYTVGQCQAACYGLYESMRNAEKDFIDRCDPATALRLRSRDGKKCLPQWIEAAEIAWREQQGGSMAYPWLEEV